MAGGEEIQDIPSAPQPMLEDWYLRPWLLAGLGAFAGLAVHLLLDDVDPDPARSAIAASIFFAFAAASFVLRPHRWVEAAVFSVGLGVVMGGIAWLAVDSGDRVAGEEFAFAAGVFFSLLAVPLFQADFHNKRWATPYSETHFHVWTDAVSAAGALAFMLLSWLLLWLLHALFSLIGVDAIEELIQTSGFAGFFCGATYGAAMGTLRNQLNILGTLQRVVLLVFSLLAVPFGFAIAVFLVFLLLSGGSALWDATDSATPILLTCALGCFVLTNSVVRDDNEASSDNVVMQAAALILAVSIFPLTVFAAISMGIRIDQYGLSPERLWALVAIAIATAYGLAYWVGLARGRIAGWAEYLRRANLHLAVASCVVALVLAFPLVDFGGISARQQVARLDAGEVTPEEFDYTALRWDFGDGGRAVLADLAERGGEAGNLALTAQRQSERPWDYWYGDAVADTEYTDQMTDTVVVYPEGSAMPDGLMDVLDNDSVCWIEGVCRVYLQEGGLTAVVLGDECVAEEGADEPITDCVVNTEAFEFFAREWRRIPNSVVAPRQSDADLRAARQRQREAIESGDVRIGQSQRRTVYIGDEPNGRQFD